MEKRHRAYNPLSYQLGSVWPHDTAIAAAGCYRYGHAGEGASLLRAILEAAACFEEQRLPELFCGLDRSDGPPVPYAQANAPQAWAAAVPLLATQLFLGLVPDVPRGRCFLDPCLPEWLGDASINRDRDLRLQYLAGMGLNQYQSARIYAEIVRYRRFPEDLFTGSESLKQALRATVERAPGGLASPAPGPQGAGR